VDQCKHHPGGTEGQFNYYGLLGRIGRGVDKGVSV
jgi:hypothetical protein